jgi:hypothetical protein
MLSNEVTFLLRLLTATVSLRAQRGNLINSVIASAAWQSHKMRISSFGKCYYHSCLTLSRLSEVKL